MVYASSKRRLTRLAAPATLGLSAPGPPTALYQLTDGAWKAARYTAVKAESGFTSVIELARPGNLSAGLRSDHRATGGRRQGRPRAARSARGITLKLHAEPGSLRRRGRSLLLTTVS